MDISPDGTILAYVSTEDIIDGVCKIPEGVTQILEEACQDCNDFTTFWTLD